MQKALITSAHTLEDVASFLPANYTAEQIGPYVRIVGEDNAGWTMDDYVLPRLASGLIVADKLGPLVQRAGDLVEQASREVRADIPALETYARFFRAAARVTACIGCAPPSDADIETAMEEWNGKRPHAKGLWKPIQRPRGDMGDLMRFWYRWHSGSGSASLFGVMMRRSAVSDAWDSLMLTARHIAKGEVGASNSSRWADALGTRVRP